MMEKYLIYSDEGDIEEVKVVTANNPEEAKFLYCLKHELKDPRALDYVYTELGHDAFNKDENGPTYKLTTDTVDEGIVHRYVLREDLTEDDAKIIFAENVRKAFPSNPEYYTLYMKFYWSEDCKSSAQSGLN